MEMAAAIDNYNTVVVTVDDVTTPGACDGDYVITRTFLQQTHVATLLMQPKP